MCIYTQFDACLNLKLLCKHDLASYNVQKYYNLKLQDRLARLVSTFTKCQKVGKFVCLMYVGNG